MIGKTISHYKIIEELGSGGMGVVYKAEDTKLKRIVALKFLPPRVLGNEKEKARFIHEAQAAAALDHPNICTIHEINEIDEMSFIIMAYVDGPNLKEEIMSGPLEVDRALTIAIQIAEGLREAHEKKIIHRDIKSANIMLTSKDQAIITDFGLAKLLGKTRLTRTGMTMGTIAYMSPEQARGEEIDHRSDLWSLGIVLYEILTGKLPFEGDYDQAVIYSILNEEAEPVRKLRPEVPVELEAIVSKTLQKNPADRYTDTEKFIDDLRKLRRGVTVKIDVPRSRKTKLLKWGIPAALLVVVTVVSLLILNRRLGPVRADVRTLAVVDFDIISGEGADHLAEGLADGISVKLSKLSNVRIVSSDDVRRLRRKDISAKEVASQLGAQFALGGSMLKSGEKIRVTPQLIDSSTGDVIWSELFDREFSDVFEFLDEVSLKIVSALEIELDPVDELALREKPTESPQAYDHYLKGRHYYYRTTARDNELAEKEFKKALLIDSEYPLALAGLADAYVQRYKERYDYDEYWLDESDRLIKEALELEDDLAEAYESKAEVLIEKENYMGALEAARKARGLRPDWDEPYLRLGEIHQLRGERSLALDLYDKALEIRPSVEGLCGKGEIYRERGLPDSAEVALKRATELNPGHDRPLYDLAGLYYDRENQDETERLLRRAIEVRPDRGRGYDELVSIMYFEHGDLQGAEELLRGFVERYPYHQEAYELLSGLMAWYKGDFPAALAVIDDAMTRNPYRVWPHILLAEAHAYKFDEHASREKALAALQKALELRPGSGWVLRNAGDLYGTLGDTRKALHYYRLALEASPGSPTILVELAGTLLNRARFDSAAVVAAEALEQAPGRMELWRTCAYDVLEDALTFQMRADEYLNILQDSAEKYGRDDPHFYVVLGMNQCLQGQYQEAITSCNRVLNVEKQGLSVRRQVTLRSLRWLGMAQWFSGDTNAARMSFLKGNETEDQWDRFQTGKRLISLLKYMGRFDEADDLIEGLREEDGMMNAWVSHAEYYYPSMRRFDKVLSVIDEALESEEVTWKTDLRLLQVSVHRQLGNLEKAEELLREIEHSFIWPSASSEQRLEWAAIEATRGKLERALRLAETAYEEKIAENRRNIYIPLLSKLYYALDRKQDALNVLADANCYGPYVQCFYRRAQMAVVTVSPDAEGELRRIQFLANCASRGGYLGSSLGVARIYSALATARLGDIERARSEIEYAVKLEPERVDIAYNAACAYSLIGDTAMALQWLETSVERGHQELWWARVDPDLDPLRELPRFKEILNAWDRHLQVMIK